MDLEKAKALVVALEKEIDEYIENTDPYECVPDGFEAIAEKMREALGMEPRSVEPVEAHKRAASGVVLEVGSPTEVSDSNVDKKNFEFMIAGVGTGSGIST